MNTTIAKFMGLAITVIIIASLIFISMVNTLSSESEKYSTHIDDNMNEFIQTQSITP